MIIIMYLQLNLVHNVYNEPWAMDSMLHENKKRENGKREKGNETFKNLRNEKWEKYVNI